jgi:hypothetical protein
MKQLLFTLALLPFSLFSQIWIDQDAEWHYSFSDGAGFGGGFLKVNYEKDTIILGNNCQKITELYYHFVSDQNKIVHLTGITQNPANYTYSSGDTVFYYINNKFNILYNFAAQKGDSWDLGVDTNNFLCSKSIVQVDSIGFVTINNQNLRWIAVSPASNSSVRLQGKIIEGIGIIEDYSLFPITRNCDSEIADETGYGSLICFEDYSFPLYNLAGKDCESPLYVEQLHANKTSNPIVFPSITSSVFNVQTSSPTLSVNSVQIIDCQGKELLMKKESNTIDIGNLSNGIYFAKIVLNNGNISFHKVIKE